MGTKYSTTSVTGYNATPPSDDGSTGADNQIFWSTIKTKLPDPLKTALESINTKLVTFADLGPVSKTATYSTVAGDHLKTLECSGTFTVSLLDASTAGAGYTVEINNIGTGTITVSRATGANTINGAASDAYLLSKTTLTFRCNASANGYNVIASAGVFSTDTTDHTITSLDAGNTHAPHLVLYRNSPSPANGDLIGKLQFSGENASGSATVYGYVGAGIEDVTAATEDGALIFAVMQAGTVVTRFQIIGGMYSPLATGGDKGAGTINAVAVYDDNVLLTDYVFDAQQDGIIDLAAYDSKVEDRKIKDKDGKTVTEVRTHLPARAFDLTELDPVAYATKCSATRRLPAMHRLHQRVGEGEKTGLGETVQALIETCEVQAVHIAKLEARLAAAGL